jgi:hypothetical protein
MSPIIIDQYSVAAKPLEMRFQGTLLATGTGFIWRAGEQKFLITNWHNVTGINPRTGSHLSSNAGEPDTVIAHLDLAGSPPGNRGPFSLSLRDSNGAPLWLEHPMARRVDVVALPLPALPGAVLHPINEMPSNPMQVWIGMNAFILGYPFGIHDSALPVWKRASIASEPGDPIDGQPCLRRHGSRSGMSGSPVLLRSWGGFQTEPTVTRAHRPRVGGWTISGVIATRFIGVY